MLLRVGGAVVAVALQHSGHVVAVGDNLGSGGVRVAGVRKAAGPEPSAPPQIIRRVYMVVEHVEIRTAGRRIGWRSGPVAGVVSVAQQGIEVLRIAQAAGRDVSGGAVFFHHFPGDA